MGDILSLGGSIPALISSSSQKDINKWNINAQREANEQNIALTHEMFDKQVQANKDAEQRAFINNLEMTKQKNQMGLEMLDYVYNKYQSPKARVEALRKAGFNPSSMLSAASGAFGNVSAPQVSDGSVASYGSPNLQAAHVDAPQISSNPDSYLMQGYDSVVNAISKVSESKKNDAETIQTLSLLTDTLKSLRLKNVTQDLINQTMEFDLALNKAFKEKDVVASINLKFAEAGRAYEAGNLDKARASVAAAEEIMIKNTNAMNAPLVRSAELIGKLVIRSYEDNHNLSVSQQTTNFASANYFNALASTENALRSGKIEMQSLQNDLMTISKYMQGNQLQVSDATVGSQIVSMVEQAQQAGLITKKFVEELKQAQKQTDWQGRMLFASYCSAFINGLGTALQSYSSVAGVHLNRLSAQERNAIQSRFVDAIENKPSIINNVPFTDPIINPSPWYNGK